MTLTNKAFGFTLEEPIEFIDIADSDWFAGAVRKAKAAGYIGGHPDGSMKPNNPISRQEAAVILSKIRGLAANPGYIHHFTDAAGIPDWSKG